MKGSVFVFTFFQVVFQTCYSGLFKDLMKRKAYELKIRSRSVKNCEQGNKFISTSVLQKTHKSLE